MAATWRTVRVFISSTFRDMHAERDYLVKVVFPSLRERLEKYRIHLVDVDLRWGSTEEEAQRDRVLDLCLEQIDECRPLFVGILGERYGWVPGTFSDEALSKYGWVQHQTGKSVTELEILYGVLRDPEMGARALFLFRDPAFLADVPEPKRAHMMAEDAESAEKLRRLKGAIREAGLPTPPLENYPCQYAGLRINWRLARRELDDAARTALEAVAADGIVDPGEYGSLDDRLRDVVCQYGVVGLAGLDTFGREVEERLWNAIRAEHDLPDVPPIEAAGEADPLAIEQDYHERFMESRLRVYVGRENVEERLTAFADGEATHPCLVTAPSGSGKSAALAKFATSHAQAHPDVLVIPHFVGASPGSTGLRQMLRRFCLVLKDRFGLAEEVPLDVNALVSRFRGSLESVPGDGRVVLVIDALNQLDETDNAQSMWWLPWELPPAVKIIASSIDDPDRTEPVLEALAHRPLERAPIEPLTDDERREIIRRVPSLSAKTLDRRQVDLLLANPATTNPLFLLVALEELRGFGSFEQLEARIAAFPHEGDTVTAVFRQVIERLREEFDEDMVRTVLALLACARSGLSERELLEIVEGMGVEESTGDLFPVLRQLRLYLQHRRGLWDFFHRNLFMAVREEFLNTAESRRAGHARLADYFRERGWSSARALEEAPFQCAHAQDTAELERIVSNLTFIEAKCAAGMMPDLLADYARFDSLGLPKSADVSDFEAMVRVSGHILVDHPYLTFQEAANQPDGTAPALAAQQRERAGEERRPWLRRLNKCRAASACRLTLLRHTGPVTACAVSPDGTRLFSGSEDHTVCVWDLATGELLRQHDGGGPVHALAVSPDGSRLVSMAKRMQARTHSSGKRSGLRDAGARIAVSDAITGEILAETWQETADKVYFCSALFVPGGTQFVTAWGGHHIMPVGNCSVWDTATCQSIRCQQGQNVGGLAVSTDGKFLVTAQQSFFGGMLGRGTVTVRRTSDGVVVAQCRGRFGLFFGPLASLPGTNGILLYSRRGFEFVEPVANHRATAITASEDGRALCDGPFAVSPDGKRVVSASIGGRLSVFDLTSGNMIGQHPGDGSRVKVCCFTPDGTQIVAASRRGRIHVWEADRFEEARAHRGTITDCEFSPTRATYVTVAHTEVGVWDAASHRCIQRIPVPNAFSCSVAPNGRTIAVGYDCPWPLAARVGLFDLETGARVFELRAGSISTLLKLGQLGRTVALTGTVFGIVGFLTGAFVGFFGFALLGYPMEKVVLLIGGVTALAATPFTILAGIEPLFHVKRTKACRFSPCGRFLLTGEDDGGIWIWLVGSGREATPVRGLSLFGLLWDARDGVTALAYSPDGRYFVAGHRDRGARLWGTVSRWNRNPLSEQKAGANVCDYSPDGRLIVVAEERSRLELFDAATHCRIAHLGSHGQEVTDCQFSLDGQFVASCSLDGDLIVWAVHKRQRVARFCTATEITSLSWRPDTAELICCDAKGEVFALEFRPGSSGAGARGEACRTTNNRDS